MHFGFGAMLLEAGAQLFGLCRLGHFRQRLQDLPFGVIDVLERIEEKIVQLLVSHSLHLRLSGVMTLAGERRGGTEVPRHPFTYGQS